MSRHDEVTNTVMKSDCEAEIVVALAVAILAVLPQSASHSSKKYLAFRCWLHLPATEAATCICSKDHCV